jgi:XTP/dITP diphosphohydrolase
MARRLLAGSKLVIATHNNGKLVEMADLLRPYGLEAVSASALGLPEPDETGLSFEENAAIKAHAAAAASKLPALADDSGLVVAGLGGAPGIYSARWAVMKDFAPAMARVERELGNNPDRHAYFVAVLALAWPDGQLETFRGEVHGSVTFPPRGTLGFGYDPIFLPQGMSETFGELDGERRMRVSHRTVAFRQLAAACLPMPQPPQPGA